MQTIKTDVVIIGSGTAGLNAVSEVNKLTNNWILVESNSYGTMCAKAGCMPSKLLIAAADASHAVDQAKLFGIETQHKHVNSYDVFKRIRKERDRFVNYVVEDTENIAQHKTIKGHAKFIGKNTIQVDQHSIIETRSVVIATGSRANIPPLFDLANRNHILLSEDIFELNDLPQNIAIIGTGNIGIEIGQALYRLGTEVTFINRSSDITNISDPLVQHSIHRYFTEDIQFHFNADMISANEDNTGVHLTWKCLSGDITHKSFEKVLIATGRVSTIDQLNLKCLGINHKEMNQYWNPETTQLGDYPIFIAGDASSYQPYLHVAANEGKLAGINAVNYPDIRSKSRSVPLTITFTDPQIAQIGNIYSDLDLDKTAIGTASLKDQGRARIMHENRGLIRIYGCKKNRKIIGSEIFSPHAEHLAHLLAWSIQSKLSVENLLEMPIYHPVLEESLRTALHELQINLEV